MYKLILTALLLITFSAGYAEDVTKKFNNKDFTEVSVCCGMKLRITKADNYSIKVTAGEKDFEFLSVEQDEGNLRFYINRNNYRLKDEIRIEISMPDLHALGLSGGAMGNVKMQTSKSFSVDLSGGSFLKGELTSGNITMDLSGGSRIELNGKAADLELNGSGGSIFELKNFTVRNVDSHLSGGSNVEVKMDGTINTSQSGGSQFTFYGNAKIGSTSFSGGSGVSKGDD